VTWVALPVELETPPMPPKVFPVVARLTVTPGTLSMAVARFESGNLPMSSAEIASTTPTDSRLMSRLFCKEARMPVTTTSSILSAPLVLVSAGAASAANSEPLNARAPKANPEMPIPVCRG